MKCGDVGATFMVARAESSGYSVFFYIIIMNIRIRNKLESLQAIKNLKLNQFPEIFLDSLDEAKINKWLLENKAEYYTIRDKITPASPKHNPAAKFDEVINFCKENKMEKFTVSVSSHNYRDNKVCVGEVMIHDEVIDYIISNNPNYIIRDVYKDFDYNGTASLFDRKLKYIKGLQEALDYIVRHNLFNIIVEFIVFNCPVGINNEKVVIGELRTDY